MSKADFIARIARKGRLSKAEAKRAVELVFGEVAAGIKEVRNGGKFAIGTFGTFSVTKRGPREGRNPRTGEPIRIRPSKSVRFRPSQLLKKAAGA